MIMTLKAPLFVSKYYYERTQSFGDTKGKGFNFIVLLDSSKNCLKGFNYVLDLYNPEFDSIHCVHAGTKQSDTHLRVEEYYNGFMMDNNVYFLCYC